MSDVEKEDYQTSIKEKEIEKLEKEKQITNQINITNKNSNNDFFNKCSAKILKGERLNIEEKKVIINFHKINPTYYSIHHLSNVLNIERYAISRWFKKETEIFAVENRAKYNLPGQGNKSCISDKEGELINYFYELWKENIAVNSSLLIKKLYSIAPELKIKSFNAIKRLLYRILKKII